MKVEVEVTVTYVVEADSEKDLRKLLKYLKASPVTSSGFGLKYSYRPKRLRGDVVVKVQVIKRKA